MKKKTAPVGVMILAAGQGKRMRSPLPKVLHEMGGIPLISHILKAVQASSPGARICIVVGHQRERVEQTIRAYPGFAELDLSFVHQPEQRGTGHAARYAMDSDWGRQQVASKAPVLVLPGDLPLIRASMLEQLLAPLGRGEALRILSCELRDPSGYGRVVRRGKQGAVLRIVEEKDANARERSISEVATSIYLFDSAFLNIGLKKLSNRNAQGEYYLTDLVAQAAATRKKIDVLKWIDEADLRGINDPWELALAARIFNERLVRDWALKGVRFLDPWSVRLDADVTLAPDVEVHPRVTLIGKTRVASGAILGPGILLKDVEVGERAHIKLGTVAEASKIGPEAQVGPYAHLRPDSEVGPRAKIGNFVELKKTRIGEKTSVAHLSYLGDAEVGKHVNIGCGFVTCNFDGRVINGQRKHKTVIEDGVFMGSDCQTVAPVKIGTGAYVASGSTITQDVEPGALAIARSKQVNKPGYAERLRRKEES